MVKRKEKISCDISSEAKQALIAYGLKHERSQGHLINRMILKFCVDVVVPVAVVKTPVKRFVPPTWKEVAHYMFDKQRVHMDEEANKFCDFYESNGWKVGKNKMKDWKAAVRNWLKGNNNERSKNSSKQLSALEKVERACEEQNRSNGLMPEVVESHDRNVHGQVHSQERISADIDLDSGDFFTD